MQQLTLFDFFTATLGVLVLFVGIVIWVRVEKLLNEVRQLTISSSIIVERMDILLRFLRPREVTPKEKQEFYSGDTSAEMVSVTTNKLYNTEPQPRLSMQDIQQMQLDNQRLKQQLEHYR